MAKTNVVEFIKWALPHSNNKIQGTYPIPYSDIATDPWGYMFGTTGQICTQQLINSKRKIPNYQKWSDASYKTATARWLGKRVLDCQGLADYFCNVNINAKGNYANWCGAKSDDIKTIPLEIGIAVFHGDKPSSIHHVGFICGFDENNRPLIIEARGTNYGVVITKFDERGWDFWGRMDKMFDYKTVEITYPRQMIISTKASPLNLRNNPNGGAVIAKMKKDAPVWAIEEKNGWVNCVYFENGQYAQGWAAKEYLK